MPDFSILENKKKSSRATFEEYGRWCTCTILFFAISFFKCVCMSTSRLKKINFLWKNLRDVYIYGRLCVSWILSKIPRHIHESAISFIVEKHLFFTIIVVSISVATPIGLMYVYMRPTHKGFFCHDKSLSYPYKEDTIPPSYMYLATCLTPLVMVSSCFRLIQIMSERGGERKDYQG